MQNLFLSCKNEKVALLVEENWNKENFVAAYTHMNINCCWVADIAVIQASSFKSFDEMDYVMSFRNGRQKLYRPSKVDSWELDLSLAHISKL